MAIDYPNSPTNGQTYTVGAKSWIWDGTTWLAYGASLSPSVLKVDSVNARVGINNQSPTHPLDVIGRVETRAAATQDGVALVGRAGGSSSFDVALTPTTLTADRTLTLPNATGTVALTSDPGLILIKTQTVGSGVSIVEVFDAFSSAYENYRIIYTGGSSSTSQALGLQFGVGSTWTNTNYFGAAAYINLGAAAWQLAYDNPGAYAGNAGGGNTTSSYLMTDVLMPNMAEHTAFHGPYILSDFGRMGTHSFAQLSTTQFTSFRIICNTGSLTGGTIRVYGYRNS